MYAIVTTGGKQYKVAKGDIIDVEKIDAEPGSTVPLEVLMLSDGKKLTLEDGALEKAKVEAKVLEQYKGSKQLVFKFKKRKRYHRTQGHRQQLTKLEITKVSAPRKRAAAKPAEDAAEAAEAPATEATE